MNTNRLRSYVYKVDVQVAAIWNKHPKVVPPYSEDGGKEEYQVERA